MLTLLTACALAGAPPGADTSIAKIPMPAGGQEVAVLAGGCFWCLESDMDKLLGVVSTTSGYTGGSVVNPTYEQVGNGDTGHTEAVWVVYDPAIVTYGQVLDYFLHHIDPTDAAGQFCDRGTQYRPGIYPRDAKQEAAAKAAVEALEASKVLLTKVATEVKPGQQFYGAEVYHQDFSRSNPTHYQRYRAGCGRDDKVAKIWARANGAAPVPSH
jgi:peptide-methionine (S)-S-oxide reductase